MLAEKLAGSSQTGDGDCTHIYLCKQSGFHTIYFIQIIKALMCLKFMCRVSVLIQILVVL